MTVFGSNSLNET